MNRSVNVCSGLLFWALLAAGWAVQAETVNIEERVPVWVGERQLIEKALVIGGGAYLPLRPAADALGIRARYDDHAVFLEGDVLWRVDRLDRQLADAGAKADGQQAEIGRLQAEINKTSARNEELTGTNATLTQENRRLEQENDRLRRQVETARYFGFRAKRVGRSIETPSGESRAVIDYWGIVTCCGEDLLVFLPTGGGPKDATGIRKAQDTAERLNEIVTEERELQPVWFVTNVTDIGREFAIAYTKQGGPAYRTMCAVSRDYAEIVFRWLKAEEANREIPKDKRLRNPEEAAELVRDWWLALLRDHVCLILGGDPSTLPGTTTKSRKSAEILLNVMRPRLAANPIPPGEVRYPPLQVTDVVERFSPEEKLSSYDIHHEEGLVSYLLDCWEPRR